MNLMKRLTLILPLLLILAGCGAVPEYTQKFALSNAKPQAGEKVTVYFLPASDAGEKEVVLKVYEYKANLTDTKDYPMEKKGKGYTATFTYSEGSRGGLLIIDNGGETENNAGYGWYVQVHGADGLPVPGSDAGMAYAMVNWAEGALDLKKDSDKAYELMKNDLDKNPGLKREFAQAYLNLLNAVKGKDVETLLSPAVAEIEAAADKSEDDYTFLIAYFTNRKNPEKVNEIKAAFKEKYPQAVYFQRVQFNEFYREQDITKKLELADKFRKDYPISDYHNDLNDILINWYRDNKKYDEALRYIDIHKEKVRPFRYYTLALRMYEEEYDIQTALKVTDMGIAKAKAEYENPADKKSMTESDADWKESRGSLIAMNLFVKALLLERSGKNDEALALMQENYSYAKGKDDKYNALQTRLLLSLGKTGDAIKLCEDAILRGYDNKDVTENLQKAYIQKNGSESGFAEYLSALEKPQRDKLISKLEKDLMNETAPQFTLVDLSGKEVSLADYKGKTVIVDFWATWCGPCLQSFPGMQNAVEKFAKDENVKFLFINAWERVTDKKTNAEDFIAKKKYTFHVLMDYENKVIGEFGVQGIPTKFVIDKNGNIRFKSVGFSGNTDHMVKEIEAMVAMVR